VYKRQRGLGDVYKRQVYNGGMKKYGLIYFVKTLTYHLIFYHFLI
jgi:hypothetical protein